MPPLSDWLSWLWVNREEIVRLLTLIGAAIGIYFLAIRTRAVDRTARAALEQAKTAADQAETAAKRHEEQTSADRERRITESFAKAVEQLGSDTLETRLGAIYTLERISQESEREYYWPIMETLTAYARERAPWLPRQSGDKTDDESTPMPNTPRSRYAPFCAACAALSVLSAQRRARTNNPEADVVDPDVRDVPAADG